MQSDRNRMLFCILSAILAGSIFVIQPVFAQDEEGSETDSETASAEEDAKLDRLTVVGKMTRYSALKSDTPIMETALVLDIAFGLDRHRAGAFDHGPVFL